MKLKITAHAYDRAAQRWGLDAFTLNMLVLRAILKEKLEDEGQEIWEAIHDDFTITDPVLFVVKNGEVKTVLPPGAKRPPHRGRK